jgi:CubicO group peptidase (beta-lactamase class C family)
MDIKPYVELIEKKKLNAEGIIVLQHGEKIAEYKWIPEKPRLIYSVSKGYTSVAAGMCLDEGLLSLNDRIIDAFPIIKEPDERLSSCTLAHCLTMSRGYPEFTMPESVFKVLSQKLTEDPGAHFVYDNSSSFLVSAMVTKATKRTVRDFLLDRLFRPLGIPDPVWRESEDGYSIGGTGLEVSTSSLAVFGQFLLQRGNWNGKQLVSERWLDCATRPHITTKERTDPDWDLGYGYHFWACRHGAFRVDGFKGQFVIVLPWENAVVAITAEEDNVKELLYAVWDTILPQF